MCLHFDCIHLMIRFFDCKYQVHLKANLSSLCFNWRGGSETCVTAAHAIIGMQKLPSLRHLAIIITPSVPMRARHKYITDKLKHETGQDIVFRMMDAIGFDELCSIRGLIGHVKVRLEGDWEQLAQWPKKIHLPATREYLLHQEAALIRYFSMLMTRKKPLDYDSNKKLRVPYYAWSDDYEVQWIGWDEENQEKRLEAEELVGW
ncbi:hypothetical protein BKA64DRAFT_721997 [Cadophora sp. MPI-SDFR-AT-0126]|nr:hypothetical protein BKA64DRAFT_721997 [Leotiomycetes sp. MPI-SDFR-AT-0126]